MFGCAHVQSELGRAYLVERIMSWNLSPLTIIDIDQWPQSWLKAYITSALVIGFHVMQIPSFFNPLSSSMPSEVYSENIVMSGRCAHEHSNHVTNCVPGNVIQVSITILYCHTITQVEFGWEYWCHPCECKSWDGGLKSAAFDPVADTSCVGDVVRQRRRWRRHQHIFF